jgi:hypothetical protein
MVAVIGTNGTDVIATPGVKAGLQDYTWAFAPQRS